MTSPDPGLCAGCVHARRIDSPKGSTFWRCTHPDRPKYPRIPVRSCSDYVPAYAPAAPSEED